MPMEENSEDAFDPRLIRHTYNRRLRATASERQKRFDCRKVLYKRSDCNVVVQFHPGLRQSERPTSSWTRVVHVPIAVNSPGELKVDPLPIQGTCIQTLLSEFTPRCVAALERAYSTTLSLSSLTSRSALMKCTSTMLLTGSANEILSAASTVCFTREILRTRTPTFFGIVPASGTYNLSGNS
jgi:hypothetical protein